MMKDIYYLIAWLFGCLFGWLGWVIFESFPLGYGVKVGVATSIL